MRWAMVMMSFLLGCSIFGIGTKKIWMSKSKEIKIGRLAAKEVEKRERLHQGFLLDYINQVGKKIIKVSERKRIPYKFKVIDSSEKTAFSLPGGFIFISSNLLKELDSESELAAVIAEEIAHVVLRHGAKYLTLKFSYDLISDLNFKGRLSQTEKNVVETALWMGRWGYGREAIFEADMKALIYLKDSGYNPLALIRAIKKMERPVSNPSASLFYLVQNYPSYEERAERINERLEKFEAKILNLPFYEEKYQVIKSKFIQ